MKPETRKLTDKEWLVEQLEVKTGRQIASELGCKEAAISYWKKKHGLMNSTRSQAVRNALAKKYPDGRYGKDAARWKGGRSVYNGYVWVYAPDRPQGRIQEHRLVAEKKLGRALALNEIVHHIDGDRANNSPDNLEVMIRGTHVRNHFQAGHEVVMLRQENKKLREHIIKLEKALEGYQH